AAQGAPPDLGRIPGITLTVTVDDVEPVAGLFAGEVMAFAHAEPVARCCGTAVGVPLGMVNLDSGAVTAGGHTDWVDGENQLAQLTAEQALFGRHAGQTSS